MAWASSSVRRLQVGSRRSAPYHTWANSQPCLREKASPRALLHCSHHLSTCSSDLKRSIVFQVNLILSHQRAAGTAKWITPASPSTSFPPRTSTDIASLQSAHDARSEERRV